jgi:TM2 domain-containing membrane protein YozV
MKVTKDIREKNKVDVLYNRAKKGMVLTYLLGAVLGGIGAHWFYLGKHEYGVASLGLFLLAMILPISGIFMLIWFLSAVVYTYFVVNQVNAEIHEELEVLHGE